MLNLNLVTVYPNGNVTIQGGRIDKLTKETALHALGVKKLCAMDSVKATTVNGMPAFKVAIAQQKPWTYITHVLSIGG